MGSMQRNKGRRAEQTVVNMLKAEGFDAAKRNLMQTGNGGYDITGLEPLAIEIKDHKKLNLSQWWQQTTQNAVGDLIPVLIYHIHNTSRWMVQIPMSMINQALCKERTVTVGFDDFIYISREMMA